MQTSSSPHDTPRLCAIISDSQPTAVALRQVLLRLGYEIPADKSVPLSQGLAAAQACQSQLRLIMVTTTVDAQRGVDLIRRIRETVTVPVFAVGPRDAGLILDTIRAGAADYIDQTDLSDEPLAKLLSRHLNGGTAASPEGRVIGVASTSGGSGASVIAVNLAAATAQRFGRVCLCDFDSRSGVCDSLLNLQPKHTLTDLARHPDRLDRSSLEMALTPHSSGIHLLPAPSAPIDEEIWSGDGLERIVALAQKSFPVVVLDLERIGGYLQRSRLLAMCDQVLLVSRLDFNSVRNTRRCLESLRRAGVASEIVHVVGNRYGQPNELPISKGESAISQRLMHFVPDDPKTVNRSINCGTPFFLEDPGSGISRAITTLANALLGDDKRSADAEGRTSSIAAPRFARAAGAWRRWCSSMFARWA